MRQLESDIVLGVLRTTTSKEEAGEILKSQRVILESYNERLVSSVARQMLASNDSRTGVILWLKPGETLAIDPKPIHLEDTLSYFIRNHHYCSTGYHVFDICTLDEDTQYRRVMEFMILTGDPKVIDAHKEFEHLELVNLMAQRYCNGTLEDTEIINDEDVQLHQVPSSTKQILVVCEDHTTLYSPTLGTEQRCLLTTHVSTKSNTPTSKN